MPRRELLVLAARALGVATAADLADYFSLDGFMDRQALQRRREPVRRVPALLAELVDDGRLHAVAVDGWRDVGYTLPGVTIPRAIGARVRSCRPSTR